MVWIKVNTDGAAKGAPGHAASGGIFQDRSGAVLGCFADYYGVTCLFMSNFWQPCHQLKWPIKRNG